MSFLFFLRFVKILILVRILRLPRLVEVSRVLSGGKWWYVVSEIIINIEIMHINLVYNFFRHSSKKRQNLKTILLNFQFLKYKERLYAI